MAGYLGLRFTARMLAFGQVQIDNPNYDDQCMCIWLGIRHFLRTSQGHLMKFWHANVSDK